MRAWRRTTRLPEGAVQGTFPPSALTTSTIIGQRRVTVFPELGRTWALPITAAAADFEILVSGVWRAGLTIFVQDPDFFGINFGAPTTPAPTRCRYNGGPPYQLDGFGVDRLGAFDLTVPFP